MEVFKRSEEILEIPETSPLKFLEGSNEDDYVKVVCDFYKDLISGNDKYDDLLHKGFNNEQIWQQIDYLNGDLSDLVPQIAKDISVKRKLRIPVKIVHEIEEMDDIQDGTDDDDDDDIDDIDDKDIDDNEGKDRFFDIDEMEKFADSEMKDDADMFDVPSDDSEGEQAKYDEFFGSPMNDDHQSDYEDIDDRSEPDIKSTFEKRRENLEKKIHHIEESALGEKPWVMKGEVDSNNRPINSLLEEDLEFDLTKRPAPIITEEVTMKLEDIILKRIKDQAYDDVVKKIKPIKTPHEFKKTIVLDQEKSKLSLAQIYENDYLKEKEKTKEVTEVKDEEELSEEKKKIASKMKILFNQLDILSNLHYTPKLVSAELKIVTNTPAINMEEVAPVGTTDADTLAPGEIAGKFKRDLLGKDERTKTDKKREKRKKKALQKQKFKRKQVDKIKLDKSNMLEKDHGTNIKSSKAFFDRLQDEVQNHISKKRAAPTPKPHLEAKKFKL